MSFVGCEYADYWRYFQQFIYDTFLKFFKIKAIYCTDVSYPWKLRQELAVSRTSAAKVWSAIRHTTTGHFQNFSLSTSTQNNERQGKIPRLKYGRWYLWKRRKILCSQCQYSPSGKKQSRPLKLLMSLFVRYCQFLKFFANCHVGYT